MLLDRNGVPSSSTSDPRKLWVRCFRLHFTLCVCRPTCSRLALEVCRFNAIYRDRLHLVFHQDFHYSATPGDDLVWSIIRGGQRWCYCDSSQKYMRACFEFLILENVFFVVCRAVSTIGDATWLPVACQNNYLSLSVRRRCTVL